MAAVLIFLLLPQGIWEGDWHENVAMTLAYIAGTVLSAIAGKIGILVATSSNGRAAEAAQKGIQPAFMVGFRGGAVMGLAVVGFSLLGVAAVLLLAGDSSIVLGFSFGASSLALFAKAGGGIFTKTADVSADLTGKVELGIPEDDPRNPAVIADNVGDNVGDVAGMGADLFDSNVAAMAAALVLAQAIDGDAGGVSTMTVFCYAALGLLASILGIATARIGKHGNPTRALNSSTYVTTAIFVALTALATALFEGFPVGDLGRLHGGTPGGGHHRHHHRLLYRRHQTHCPAGGPRLPLRLGVHHPLRRVLRVCLRPAGHDRHCGVGPVRLPDLRAPWAAVTPSSASPWRRWACSPSWA